MLVYKFEQISTPATYFEIVAASGNRVVGSRGNDAILWDGAIHALPLSGPTGSGSASAEARGVNSRGDIVGRWGGEGFVRRSDGTTIYMSSFLGSAWSEFADINDFGLAVGYVQRAGKGTVFTFDMNNNSLVDQGAPAGVDAIRATAINNNGDIAGKLNWVAQGHKHAFLLRAGVFIDLGPIEIGFGRTPQITNDGLIGVSIGTGNTQASVYDINKPQLGWQQKGYFYAFDMNDSGVFAGTHTMWVAMQTADILSPDPKGVAPYDLDAFGMPWNPKVAQCVNEAGVFFGYGWPDDWAQPSREAEKTNFRATLTDVPAKIPKYFMLPLKIPEHVMQVRWPPPSSPWWLPHPVPHPPQPPWPSAAMFPHDLPLDANSQELMRGLMLNQLAQDLTDEKGRELIKNASLDVIMRALERLRR